MVGVNTAFLLQGKARDEQIKAYQSNVKQVSERWDKYKKLPTLNLAVADKWPLFERSFGT